MNRINIHKQAEDIGIEVEALLSLYSLFVEQTAADISEIENYISKKDSKAIHDMAHHIKGASLNLELYTLVESAKSLLALSEIEDWDNIGPVLTEFKTDFNDLKLYIQKVENE